MTGEPPTSNVTYRDEVAPTNWQFLTPCFEWRLSSFRNLIHFTLETCHKYGQLGEAYKPSNLGPYFSTSNLIVGQGDWCCSSTKHAPDLSGSEDILAFLAPKSIPSSRPWKGLNRKWRMNCYLAFPVLRTSTSSQNPPLLRRGILDGLLLQNYHFLGFYISSFVQIRNLKEHSKGIRLKLIKVSSWRNNFA